MRGHRTLELSPEILGAERLQRPPVELVWQTALVPKRQRVAVVECDIGVGGIFEPSVRTAAARSFWVRPFAQPGPDRLAGFALCLKSRRSDEAISVRRFAISKLDRVDHSIAIKPMIAATWLRPRIRP